MEKRLMLSVLASEQLFAYILNRARDNPVAYQNEQSLSVNLSSVTPRPPLAVNNSLFSSAGFKAEEMATRNYFDHYSPYTGYANKLTRTHGYALDSSFADDANYVESLTAGFPTPITGFEALNEYLKSSPHRSHLMGIGSFWADNREIGVGYAYNAASYARNYWAVHATRSSSSDQFLTGVAYNDSNGNQRYDANEGLSGVTVTADQLSTVTNAAGGWSIKVTNDEYLVSASGGSFAGVGSVPVVVNGNSVEVDFISGLSTGYVKFELWVQPTVNSAPVLNNSGDPTLTAVDEEETNPPGNTIASVVGTSISDADNGAVEGVALIALSGTGNGVWQFSANSGSSWTAVGSVSTNSARLLRDNDKLRFLPNADFNGTASVSYYAWDQTSGTAGSLVNALTRGGTTAFSTASDVASITVNPVNDAPTLNALANLTIDEDASQQMVNLAGITPGGGESQPLKVTASSNSTGLVPHPTVIYTSANSTGSLQFTPLADQNGTATITVTVEDGGHDGNLNTSADNATFSRTFNVTVNAINDAPVLDNSGSPTLTQVPLNTTNPAGDLVANLLGSSVTDVDHTAEGLAVVGLEGTANGKWQFSTDAGSNWIDFGSVSSSSARLLRDIDKVRFVPNVSFTGWATMTYHAWDQTVGVAGQTTALSSLGGSTPFSLASETAGVEVREGGGGSFQGLGSEFAVNTYTTSAQREVAVSGNSAGQFVVVWESAAQDGSDTGIYGQRYRANGAATGSEFLVNTTTANDQNNPTVAMGPDGSFVVSWTSMSQPGGHAQDIYAQRYNSTGVPLGSEFRVNSTVTSSQQRPDIAIDANGNFVVVWDSNGQDSSSCCHLGVYGQRFNSTGQAQGSEFLVNTYTAHHQNSPTIAMDAVGNFVVAWRSYEQDGDNDGIFAQRFNASGTKQGTEFQVNTFTANPQDRPSVAMDSDGDFVVTWMSNGQDVASRGDWGIYAQRFNSSGAAQGAEFRVNTTLMNEQMSPSVAMDASGRVLIAWRAPYQDGDSIGVFGQLFESSGTRVGSEFQINTFTTNRQDKAEVASNGDGDFVVAWQSEQQDGSSDGIFAQRYGLGSLAVSNQAPVQTVPGGQQVDQDKSLVIGGISLSDADSAAGHVMVTIAVLHGTLTVNAHVVGGLVDGNITGNGTAQVVLIGALDQVNAVLSDAGGLTYRNNANYVGVDTLTIKTDDQGNTGTGGSLTDSDTVAISVIGANVVPTLNAFTNLTIDEDASQQTVNLAGITPGGGESQPLKVTASSNNTGLVPHPTVTYTSANSTGSLQFTPLADQNGTTTITVTVEDGGHDGNLSTSADNASFSRVFNVTVNAINDAPVLNNSGDPTLTAVDEEETNPPGNTIASVVGTSISDADNGAVEGVALIALSGTGNGVWQFSANSGSSWTAVGSVSTNSARLLRDNDKLRFLPNADFNGTASVSYYAWDQTSGTAGSLVNALTRGGTTAFSTASDVASITVNPVNDAPTLNALANLTIDEDASQQMVNLAGITPGGGESQPLKVTASSNSTGLVPHPTVIYTSANSTGSLQFTPLADQNGTATITVTVEDGGHDGNLNTSADNATFSRTFNVTVNAINDAPVLDNSGSPTLTQVPLNTTNPAGDLVANLLGSSVTDVDHTAEGLAVVGLEGTANGKWQFSTDAGSNWIDFGSVSSSSARLLRDIDKVRFVPNVSFTGWATMTYHAWDQTVGVAGQTTALSSLGGSTPFSLASETAGVEVSNPDLDILASEQSFVYMLNRARHDPVTYQNEQSLSVDLSSVTPRPPLAVNNSLYSSAGFKAEEMATRNYFGHTSPYTGYPNKLTRTHGYALDPSFPDNSNQVESLAGGTGTAINTLNTLIIDAGVSSLGHRKHLLGIDSSGAANREIGVGYGYNASASYRNYWAIHITRSNSADQFLTGVAYNDSNGNQRYDANEGLSGVTVTADQLSTVTNAAGGWSIPVTDGEYLVHASGGLYAGVGSVPVVVTGNSIEVDFISGLGTGYADFDLWENTAPTLNPSPSPTLPPVLVNNSDPPAAMIASIVGDSITDPDPKAFEGIAVSGLTQSSNGTWQYSLNSGGSWTTFGSVSATSARLLQDSDLVRFVPDAGFIGSATITYHAWDQTSGSTAEPANLSSNTGGTSAFSTVSATAMVTVITQNTAPLLNDAANPKLSTITEDSSGLPGNTVGEIVGAAITDPDPGAAVGVAVVGVTGQNNGSWEFSRDAGETWTAIGSVSANSARLLGEVDRILFVPNTDFNGSATITYHAWDQMSGTVGGHVDLSGAAATGGQTAFSVKSDMASISVTPVNDAPVIVDPGDLKLNPVPPNLSFPIGQTVASFLKNVVTDVDSNASGGIAVIGHSGSGTFWFHTGSWWSGTMSPNSAPLLRADDLIAFKPDTNSNGSGIITFRAWDQTTGPDISGRWANLSSASSVGGTTAYSVDTASASVAVGETTRPTVHSITRLDTSPTSAASVSFRVTFSEAVERVTVDDFVATTTSSVSASVASISGSGAIYSVAVGSITGVGTLRLEFASAHQDILDLMGNSLSLSGFAGSQIYAIDDGTPGNNAPILNNSGSPTLTAVDEEETNPPGNTIASVVGTSITDLDNGSLEGVALIALGGTGNGVWQFSANSGGSWTAVGSVATNSARLLRDNDKLRFLPNADFNGTASVSYYAWDQTSGTAGSLANALTRGGTTAFSTASDVASITVTPVNDIPVLATLPALTLPEDGAIHGNATRLADFVSDIDSDKSKIQYRITNLNSIDSRFGISIDMATNSDQFAARTGNAIHLHPATDFNGQATVIVEARDLAGGLSQAQAFTVTVTPENDNPILATLPALTLPEDGAIHGNATKLADFVSDIDSDKSKIQYRITNLNSIDSRFGISIDMATNSDQFAARTGNAIHLHPATDFNGQATVIVEARDLAGGLSQAQAFTVTVTPENDNPILATLPALTLPEDGAIHGNATKLADFVSDIDSDKSKIQYRITNLNSIDSRFGISIDMATNSDQFAARTSNAIHLHPATDFNGQATVIVEARDLAGGPSQAQAFDVTVTPVNDKPIAQPVTHRPTENSPFEKDKAHGLETLSSDVENDPLTFSLADPPDHGQLVFSEDGSYRYTPNANFNRTDSFGYRAHDGQLASDVAIVTLQIDTTYEWYNGKEQKDVNDDALVTPLDALWIINTINNTGSHELTRTRNEGVVKPFLDVNRDYYVTPLDALWVINHLNEQPAHGEGEAIETSQQATLAVDLLLTEQPVSTARRLHSRSRMPASTNALAPTLLDNTPYWQQVDETFSRLGRNGYQKAEHSHDQADEEQLDWWEFLDDKMADAID